MSDQTKATGETKANGRPTQAEIKAGFDRLATLLSCGSTYCVHNIPPDIAVGLTMMQEALGWVLGHKESAEAMDRVLALLKARQAADEVLNYDVAGGTIREQTDAMMAAMGKTRQQMDPLEAMLASMAGQMPPGMEVRTGVLSGAAAEAFLALLGVGRRRGKAEKAPTGQTPTGEAPPEKKGGGVH